MIGWLRESKSMIDSGQAIAQALQSRQVSTKSYSSTAHGGRRNSGLFVVNRLNSALLFALKPVIFLYAITLTKTKFLLLILDCNYRLLVINRFDPYQYLRGGKIDLDQHTYRSIFLNENHYYLYVIRVYQSS